LLCLLHVISREVSERRYAAIQISIALSFPSISPHALWIFNSNIRPLELRSYQLASSLNTHTRTS